MSKLSLKSSQPSAAAESTATNGRGFMSRLAAFARPVIFTVLAAACVGDGDEKPNFEHVFHPELSGKSASGADGGSGSADGGADGGAAPNPINFCVDLSGTQNADGQSAHFQACNANGEDLVLDQNTAVTIDENGIPTQGTLDWGEYDGTLVSATPGLHPVNPALHVAIVQGREEEAAVFAADPVTPPPCEANDPMAPCHQCVPTVEDCNGNGVAPDCAEPGGSCNPNNCEVDVLARVGSESGSPVAGATVAIQGDDSLETWTTGDDGNVNVRNLPCRLLEIDVTAAGYGSQPQPLDLREVPLVTLTFPLQPLTTDTLAWTEWLPPCDAGGPPLPLNTIPVFLDGQALPQSDLTYSSPDPAKIAVGPGECDGDPATMDDVCYACPSGQPAGTGEITVHAATESISATAQVEIRTIE